MKPGDVVLATLAGAVETKVRPAVVIYSDTYLVERPDLILGILTSKIPEPLASTDYILRDWRAAGLRVQSCFRAYVLTIRRTNATVLGHLSELDWFEVRKRVRAAFVG